MTSSNLKITLAQLNPASGGVLENTARMRETYFEADARGADLVAFPDLSVTGCPPEELTNNGDFPAAVDAALAALRAATKGRKAALALAAPVWADDGRVLNAGMVFADGVAAGTVFAGTGPARGLDVRGARIGLMPGEDAACPDLARCLRDDGAQVLISLAASPFRPGVLPARVRDIAGRRVSETGLPMAYVNIVGGQDETVFDGASFCLDARGRRVLQLPGWEECVMDWDTAQAAPAADEDDFPDRLEELWRTMVLGLGDYARKSGFTDVVLGMSGGMDSALAAAVAGDALGPDHVHCLRLPSRYTSDLSNEAAEEMCRAWGFSMDTVAIAGVVEAALASLTPLGKEPGKLTRENMQARARGYLLMTLSNDRGWLLLSTGNKSEIAVGYATLYGDMCGGYNPLKDVFKTTVFALAKWRNEHRPAGMKGPEGVVIPPAIIERPPSAELAPGQLDTDSLPPYPVLDAILTELLEKGKPLSAIIEMGFAPALVERVAAMAARAEYKRRQGAPGPDVSGMMMGRGCRFPLVNRFDAAQIETLRGMAY